MDNSDVLIDFFKYFSKFVPKEVLQDMFKLPEASKEKGYGQLMTEILNQSSDSIIDDISLFMFSANEKFVSDRIKDSNKDIILFVEYGSIKYNPTATNGVKERLAITVAREFNVSNNDALNEVLIMNQCNNILKNILKKMDADQNELDFCHSLINFPVELLPVDSTSFFGNCGWTAIFETTKNEL